MTTIKLADKKVIPDRTVDLEMQWLVDGETLLIPGQNMINILNFNNEEDTWDRSDVEQVFHSHPISSLLSISNEVLLTYSDSDKVMKIWRMDEEGCNM